MGKWLKTKTGISHLLKSHIKTVQYEKAEIGNVSLRPWING